MIRTLHPRLRPLAALALLLSSCGLVLAACSESGSSSPGGADRLPPLPSSTGPRGSQQGLGTELEKPGGGTFFLDPHQSGTGTSVRVAETFWGRLVDVHDVDDEGRESSEPRLRDFVVNANIQSDGADYTLATSPITQRARLVLHAKKGSKRFEALLRAAAGSMPVIVPKNDGGTSAPPFSLVPRNACLVVRIDDLLDDDAAAAQELFQNVRVRVGLPPLAPFEARLLFDPNHGGVVAGAFHSTRVLIDLTVSEHESAALPVPLSLNPLGLPASPTSVDSPTASLRIPTQVVPSLGQFTVLRNLAGNALATQGDVIDAAILTRDIVRAVRSGNAQDPSNGFLLDLEEPRVVGGLPVVVDRALAAGGLEFLVDLDFPSACIASPLREDVLSAGGTLLEVLEPALTGPQGIVRKVRVRAAAPIADPATLLGNGLYLANFAPARLRRTPAPCWLSFLPEPDGPQPGSGVSTTAQVLVRFDEPMDPAPMGTLDSFLVVRGPATPGTSTASATTTVLGEVQASVSLETFHFQPLLPLAHAAGVADPYHVELAGVHDLAGNPLRDALPFVDFRIDPLEATQANGSVVLRLSSPDEVGPDGFPDLRGQFFYDLDRGAVFPRPVLFSSWPVDRTRPVPSIMNPFPRGVSTPLSPLGSKLHAVWRYCDVGWNVRDEMKYDLDVSGLSWSPSGGAVVSDFYEQFEIRLAHSRFLPDETLDTNLLPRWSNSGLRGSPNPFTDNILVDPASPQKVVHPKALGYSIRPADAFIASTGTKMMPFPLNRVPGQFSTYTWRDTTVQAKAGPGNAGIPMDIEQGPPLFLEPTAGTIASAGSVPSIGLPLLMEFRCYPSNTALGLNALDVSLAINSSPMPAFRAFSSGGFDRNGQAVTVNPDTELVPAGGFNPLSSPPGLRTLSAECVSYIGQIDTVTRVSRAHTIWLDTGAVNPDYVAPFVAPFAAQLPAGTAVVLDFRGAVGFSGGSPGAEFDAARIDAYGELATRVPSFKNGVASWTDDIQDMDGARYLQVRMTFVNNVATTASPELSVLGIPFAVN